jgi:hypothetical protein
MYRMGRQVYLVSLNGSTAPVSLLETVPAEAAEFVWLDDSSVGYLNGSSFFLFPVHKKLRQEAKDGAEGIEEVETTKVLEFPEGVNPTGLKYQPETGNLIFQGQVWADGEFERTGKNDKLYADRGTTGVVFDDLFVRQVECSLSSRANC